MNYDEGWRRLHWILVGLSGILVIYSLIDVWPRYENLTTGRMIYSIVGLTFLCFVPLITLNITIRVVKWLIDGFRKKREVSNEDL